MATTSKEGSRRVNYPILTQGGSDNKSQCGTVSLANWIENNVQLLSISHWRASLVPAAAVIPAPIAYINVVAVKKLVVEVRECVFMRASLECSQPPPSNRCSGVFSYFTTPLVVYCEKIRVFKAGVCLNRLAWNND